MTPDHFVAVRALFNQVIDLPGDAREARLRTLTADNDVIRDVLKICCATDGGGETSFSVPVNAMLSSVSPLTLAPGDTLGAWRIVSVIGRGGMGAVFRARRNDGHFEQDAAVKVLHGIPSAKSLEYLARERQILATLSHPNIARLLDGGATPGGQPYLVMEHVEGIAIDSYCRERQLATRDVLKLMMDVCSAISFAHQHLIVHCDIKPSNILVAAGGRVVLLDFGIARLVDGSDRTDPGDAPEVPATDNGKQTLAHAFTPQYASPEQSQGGVLTTATDVYSLGKMLRELLAVQTGGRPRIDGELAAIIDKAANADLTKRYMTASALMSDIERYLQRLPVKAVAPTLAYGARKFAQRHWPWLATGALVIVTIGVAVERVFTERDRAQVAERVALQERDATQLAREEALRERDGARIARTQAEQQRDRVAQAERASVLALDRARSSESNALMERNKARQAERASVQTGEFLISIFENSTPNAQSSDIPASKLLAAAESRLDKSMQDQPQLQSELYHTLGIVQKNMVAYPKSIALHERAIAIERKNDRPLVLARMLFQLVTTMHFASNRRTSLARAREALQLREKHLPPDAAEVGMSLSQVGSQLSLGGRFDEAEPYLKRGLAILHKVNPDSEDTSYALVNMSYFLKLKGDEAGAEAAIRRALAIRMVLLGEFHELTLRAQEQLGLHLQDAGRFVESETIVRQGLDTRLRWQGADNWRVANLHYRLGDSLQGQGRSPEALAAYRKALAIIVAGDAKGEAVHGSVLRSLAISLDAMGDRQAALDALLEAQPYWRSIGPSRRASLAVNLRHAGYLMTQLGRHDEARLQLREALELFQSADVPSRTEIARSHVYLLDWAGTVGNLDEADRHIEQLRRSMPMKDESWQAHYLRAAARVAERRGKLAEALSGYAAAEVAQAKASGQDSPGAWAEKVHRVRFLREHGSAAERAASADLAREALDKLSGQLVPGAPVLARLRELAVAPPR